MNITVDNQLSQRQKEILFAIGRILHRTNKPVSSAAILNRGDIDVSPATVRADMLRLEELGFLMQPHTSAGRTLTDKGWRLFVDDLMSDAELARDIKSSLRTQAKAFKEQETAEAMIQIAQLLAEKTDQLAIASVRTSPHIQYAGLLSLFDYPEYQQFKTTQSVIKMLEQVEDYLDFWYEHANTSSPTVLIGNENPLTGRIDASLLLSGFTWEGGPGFVAILGPRRMDYARNVALLEEACRYLCR